MSKPLLLLALGAALLYLASTTSPAAASETAASSAGADGATTTAATPADEDDSDVRADAPTDDTTMTIKDVTVHSSGVAQCWVNSMAVDADGAPTAYGPNGGLDYIGNAHKDPQDPTSAWVGVVTDANGNPVLNSDGDYVSTTALVDTSVTDKTDQTRYVDASVVNYLACGKDVLAQLGAALADLCYVVNLATGQGAPGLLGDIAPKGHMGECSVAMAAAVGVNSSAKNGGVSGKTIGYVVFPGTGKGFPNPTYQADAQAAFDGWGGLDLLKSLVGGDA